MGEMRILGVEGDTQISWDAANVDEVKAARETFERLVTNGSHLAYKVGTYAGKGLRLYKFDPGVEKMILAPPIAGG